jgi:DNA replication and repair protein RecF
LALQQLRIEQFRCLECIDISPGPAANLIVGANGAGKTSVLESIFLLGRGRSFRTAQTAALIKTGAAEATVFGAVHTDGADHRVGVRLGGSGMEIQLDGASGSISELASILPVQVIDPQVHDLVQGPPQLRRRFLDWGVFHVKQEFLQNWRRYRRTLQQRNRALREGLADEAVQAWDAELIAAGNEVDAGRREYLAGLQPWLARFSAELLDLTAAAAYSPGWRDGVPLAEALKTSWSKDVSQRNTQVGPHRAELRLTVDEQAARHRLSRGQQKLLGASMVLAQSELVAADLEQPVLLLVDEPAAELDESGMLRLIEALENACAQLFISALSESVITLRKEPQVFHVKHGEVRALV